MLNSARLQSPRLFGVELYKALCSWGFIALLRDAVDMMEVRVMVENVHTYRIRLLYRASMWLRIKGRKLVA